MQYIPKQLPGTHSYDTGPNGETMYSALELRHMVTCQTAARRFGYGLEFVNRHSKRHRGQGKLQAYQKAEHYWQRYPNDTHAALMLKNKKSDFNRGGWFPARDKPVLVRGKERGTARCLGCIECAMSTTVTRFAGHVYQDSRCVVRSYQLHPDHWPNRPDMDRHRMTRPRQRLCGHYHIDRW